MLNRKARRCTWTGIRVEKHLIERNHAGDWCQLQQPVPTDPRLDLPECQRAIAAVAALGQADHTATISLSAVADEQGQDMGQIGEYKRSAKLDEGGMDAVYKALLRDRFSRLGEPRPRESR